MGMTEQDKLNAKRIKCFHLFNFALISITFGIFVGVFYALDKREIPECWAPKNEETIDTLQVDVQEQFRFLTQWGFYTNIVFSAMWLCSGLCSAPFSVGDPVFFICTMSSCVCIGMVGFIPQILVFMAPVILFSYPGRYCSGLLMVQTEDEQGVDTLKDIASGLTSAWIAYVIVVAVGL